MPEENKTLEKIVKTVKWLDRRKKSIEPGIDKVLLTLAANGAIIYKVSELIDNSELSDPTNALIMLGTGVLLTVGNYITFKSDNKIINYTRKIANKINRALDKYRPISWIKTGLLATWLTISAVNLAPYAHQVYDDFFHKDTAKQTGIAPEEEAKQTEATPDESQSGIEKKLEAETGTEIESGLVESSGLIIRRNRPAIYDHLSYTSNVQHDFSGTKLADKESAIGRIQRTLRWKPIYQAIEQIYGLEPNTLAGMIMEESYGDPVQPNAQNDGGFGIVHEQGPLAPEWGGDVFGNSTRYNDKQYGKKLAKMIRGCNYDATCIQEKDERAHLIKALDIAARIVKTGINVHETNDYGIEFFRAPGRVGKHTGWEYLSRVKKWKADLEDEEMLKKTADDFKERNGYEFDEYLKKWHEMAGNWGLKEYVDAMTNANNPHWNKISSRDKDIRVGKSVYYTAKPGDTVFGITHRIAHDRVTADQFRKQNHIRNNNIIPNQRYLLYKSR